MIGQNKDWMNLIRSDIGNASRYNGRRTNGRHSKRHSIGVSSGSGSAPGQHTEMKPTISHN